MRGCGVGKLDFGKCRGYSPYTTNAYLNGKYIAGTNQLSMIRQFEFQDGDILELKGSNEDIKLTSDLTASLLSVVVSCKIRCLFIITIKVIYFFYFNLNLFLSINNN